MRVRFLPQDATFYQLLTDQAQKLPDANLVLAEMSGIEPEERRAARGQMDKVCNEVDEATHAVLRALRESYVTPVDRQDVFELADAVQAACHSLEAVAYAMGNDALRDLPAGAVEMLAVLDRQAELTVGMTRRLRSMRELWEFHDEITRQAKQARILHQRIGRILTTKKRLSEYAAGDQLAGSMLEATKAFRQIGVAVGRIVVKES
ncbi:hypothetical protein LWF01_01630 [Saxibacter everestensis]|uniref:DUF47 family protein n=1 Tax=Saxibacter everestensis TaxID=2909229 RepID=A0ABY8QU39_9MICO|nr:hypothetical protein LWF01_01630 [Brevibacteriaceae bacterium ZFBP1038]